MNCPERPCLKTLCAICAELMLQGKKILSGRKREVSGRMILGDMFSSP